MVGSLVEVAIASGVDEGSDSNVAGTGEAVSRMGSDVAVASDGALTGVSAVVVGDCAAAEGDWVGVGSGVGTG